MPSRPPGPRPIPPAGGAADQVGHARFLVLRVRDFHFGAIEEFSRRFHLDGIEITFRSGNHFPYIRSISSERQRLMTELRALKPGTCESGTTDHMAFQSRIYLRPMTSGFLNHTAEGRK